VVKRRRDVRQRQNSDGHSAMEFVRQRLEVLQHRTNNLVGSHSADHNTEERNRNLLSSL
jgi:hypothetical protein